MKKQYTISILLIITIVVVGFVFWAQGREAIEVAPASRLDTTSVTPTAVTVPKESPLSTSTEPTMSIGDASIRLDVARTPEEHTQGLSGRATLSEGEGMLFVFDKPGTYGFWMPDMQFAIDMIWLDTAMRVVHIKENATPESYPEIFRPDTPAMYVLEVPVGFAQAHGIARGVQAVTQNL